MQKYYNCINPSLSTVKKFYAMLYHFHQNLNCSLQTLSGWKRLKVVIWERVNTNTKCISFCVDPQRKHCSKIYSTLYHTIPSLNDLKKQPFENIVGKQENAGYQHFLLFPQCFLPFQRQTETFELNSFCPLQVLSI